jgi:hypothetical protein
MFRDFVFYNLLETALHNLWAKGAKSENYLELALPQVSGAVDIGLLLKTICGLTCMSIYRSALGGKKRKINFVPLPFSLSKLIVPFIDSVTRFTTAKPKP